MPFFCILFLWFFDQFPFSLARIPQQGLHGWDYLPLKKIINLILLLLSLQLPPGVSLGFAGLSEVFTEMTHLFPPLWSSLFYLLLFLLSSSSMLGMIEIVVTTCKEMKLFSRTWRTELICGESLSCLLLNNV